MSDLTKYEKFLIDKIDNNKGDNIKSLRDFTKRIWDNPRIITYFTDHGLGHSQRVAKRAVEIIKTHPKKHKSLEEDELFVLLAGIYLHDIGMQCDISKFPKIKKIAEEMGANFNNIDLSKKEDYSGYSKDQQYIIRENHHYLSAAYIKYAWYDKGGDGLHNKISYSIDKFLISDVIDICKFHSKLSIDDCKINFDRKGSNKKRRVAAILRLADEMDADSKRVDYKAIESCDIPPKNKRHWYLHDNTILELEGKGKGVYTFCQKIMPP
ncbi:MAG: hypothetical protein K8T10_19965 [Candidatus Eremiobacteraeota bacterium]|nr:hypothetical protein [Candidatus Eremiobacteraeota bacterium]